MIELLSGRPLFSAAKELPELIDAKRKLADRLSEILPEEVSDNDLLMNFCRGMIAADPDKRFQTAEAAELMDNEGAAAFHRQLVKNDLASEYDNDIRIWIEELLEIEQELTSQNEDLF